MAGKAPSRRKDKTHNSRPYDRPNQGIFGKVASKVKDLFTPSLWFSFPNWIKTEEVDGSMPTTHTDEDDLTENEEESTQIRPTASKPRLPIRPAKRPRYDNNVSGLTIESSRFLLGPSTSQDRTVIEVEDEEITPTIPNYDKKKTDTQILNNVSHLNDSRLHFNDNHLHLNDSHSHFNDSLSHLNDSRSHLSDSRTTLWSCGTQTAGKSFPQRPSTSNRPSFNVSSFGRTALMSSSPSLKIPSPFYEGNTTYGGASAYRKKSLAPYQINSSKSLRNQLKVKENTASDGMECMSSAARRILHTLERMSTPIIDAKRMPHESQSSPDVLLPAAPPSHRLKSYLTASSTPAVSIKGPPLVNLSAVRKVPVLKTRSSRITRNSMMEIPIRSSSPSIFDDPVVPIQQMPPSQATSSKSPAAGGKMKTKRHCIHSSMERSPEESVPEYDLRDVRLNVTTGVPVLNLGTQSVVSEKSRSSSVEKKSEEPQFTFSDPIEYSMPQATIPSPKMTSSFKFSPPLVVTPEKKPAQKTNTKEPKESEGLILSGSVNDILKNMRDKKKSEKVKKQEKSVEKKDGVVTTNNGPISNIPDKQFSSGFGDRFKTKPGSWACDTCFIRNDSGALKCVACEALKPTVAETKKVDKTSTKPAAVKEHEPGSWECKTCSVRNKSSATKCVACEPPATQKPSVTGFGDKFKPQTGTWECSVCMIRNVPSAKKCVACETPNPNPSEELPGKEVQKSADPKKLSIISAGDKLFQNTADTWECDTCLVRNATSSIKCAACETLKPTTGKTSNDAKFGFKFGASAQNSPASTFKFGSLVSTSVPTPAAPSIKFGVPSKPTSDIAVSESGFKFGSPATTTKSSKIIVSETGFKIGDTTTTSKPVASTMAPQADFKFGVPLQTVDTSAKPTAIFGSQDSNKRTLNSLEDEKELSKPAELFKFGSQSTPTTTNEKNTVPVSSSDLFNVNKPMVFTNSSVDSSGFKLLDSTKPLSTAGFKFGTTPLENPDAKETKSEESQQQTQPSTIAPTSIFGSVGSTIHSTKVTENGQKASDNTTVLNAFKPAAPFTFGAPTNTVASSVSLGGNSNVSSFGQFGNSNSKPQEPQPFKMVDSKPSLSGLSAASVIVKPSTTVAATPFNFSKPPAFNTFATSTPASKPETTSSNEAQQKTMASSMSTSATFPNFASTPSTFVFGSPNPSASTTASTFAFGSPAQAAPSSIVPAATTNSSTFAFGSVTTSNEAKPGFAVPKPPAFGTANTAAVSTPFKFGATSQQAPSGNFAFSAAPKLDAASAPGKFTFGAGPISTQPTFTAFQPSQPTTATSTMPGFNFGSNPSNSSSAFKPAAKFTFGAKPGLNAPANPPSVFGAPAVQIPVFGGTTASPAFGNPAAPAFGNLHTAAKRPEPTGGFNFAATSAPTSSPSPFMFGAPVEKKAATGTAPTAGFNFMAPQAPQADASGGFSTNFSMSTPQNFNFSATSTPTNQPFQFAAVGEGGGNATAAVPGARRFRRAVRRGIRKD